MHKVETSHLIAEIEADFDVLDDLRFLERTCETACRKANATIVTKSSIAFAPQGCTVLYMLSESHLSIHTWPERGTAAIDIFTCGDHTDPYKAYKWMLEELQATERGYQFIRRPV